MERVKAAQGAEIDLTVQELQDMETWPELQKKFLINEEEGGEKMVEEKDAKAAAPEGTISSEEAQKILSELVDDFTRSLEAKKGNTVSSEIFDEDDRLNISTSGNAPPLGKVPGVEGLYKHAADPEDEGLDDEGTYQFLKKVTGMSVRDILSLFTKTLVTRFVTNQTRLGKVRSASVMVIAGNGNGRLGVGVAKSADFGTAAMAARMLAIRNMKPIRRYENRTIYGTVRQKVSGTIVELRARPPGEFFLLSFFFSFFQ
jgi:small subunit ribosomal protein S5